MRYFLLVALLFFATGWVLGQEKDCLFRHDSIIKPDQEQTKKLVKEIAAMQLTPYHDVGKIPVFIKEAFLCWNNEWKLVNPEPETTRIKIDSVLSNGRLLRNADDSALALAYATNISGSKRTFNPDRQLMYLGLNEQYMLIAYIGDNVRWQYCPVMLFTFENKKIISVMYWGSSSEEVKTKEDVLKSLQCLKPFVIASL